MSPCILILMVGLITLLGRTEADLVTCPGIEIERLGCFKDEDTSSSVRCLPDLVLTARDKTSSVFFGEVIDWSDWTGFLQKFICGCANVTLGKGFKDMGLQYYGECWSGAGNYKRYGSSTSCVTYKYAACAANGVPGDCIGKQTTNYIYRVKRTVVPTTPKPTNTPAPTSTPTQPTSPTPTRPTSPTTTRPTSPTPTQPTQPPSPSPPTPQPIKSTTPTRPPSPSPPAPEPIKSTTPTRPPSPSPTGTGTPKPKPTSPVPKPSDLKCQDYIVYIDEAKKNQGMEQQCELCVKIRNIYAGYPCFTNVHVISIQNSGNTMTTKLLLQFTCTGKHLEKLAQGLPGKKIRSRCYCQPQYQVYLAIMMPCQQTGPTCPSVCQSAMQPPSSLSPAPYPAPYPVTPGTCTGCPATCAPNCKRSCCQKNKNTSKTNKE